MTRAAAVLVGALTGLVFPRPVLAQQSGRQPPVLTVFAINDGFDEVSSNAPTLLLSHTVVGVHPSEYRVSRRADFAQAQWLPYEGRPTLRDWFDAAGDSCDRLGRTHTVTLFFQVRAVIGEDVRIVNGQRQLLPVRVESNVLRDTICARVGPDQ